MLLCRDQRAWHRKGPFVPTGPDDVRVVTIPSFNVNQVPEPNPSPAPARVCMLSFVSFVVSLSSGVLRAGGRVAERAEFCLDGAQADAEGDGQSMA